MFISMRQWGYPHDIQKIVELYERGQMTLEHALDNIGAKYGSHISEENTAIGKRTVINFGTPVVAAYLI